MQTFEFKSLLRWLVPLATVLMFAACGGSDDDNPGDIVAASNSTLPANAFTSTLTGAQETPPTLSVGTGSGVVLVDPATRLMKATLITAGLTPTAAHIHEGASGVVGPIVFPLTESPAGSGIWTTQVTLTEAQFNIFKAGNYYFNAHSTTFPNGEIRGQILQQLQTSTTLQTSGSIKPANTTTTGTANRYASFINVLTANQVVPATSTAGSALAIMIVDTVGKTLTGAVTSIGIAGNGASLRDAAAGIVGIEVFPLAETAPGSGIWTVRTVVNDAQINALNISNYYYEIRSAVFPKGEIRGQIVPTAGTNGIGTSGTTGATGTTGAAGATGTTSGGTGAGTGAAALSPAGTSSSMVATM